jgi:hypothetical protein
LGYVLCLMLLACHFTSSSQTLEYCSKDLMRLFDEMCSPNPKHRPSASDALARVKDIAAKSKKGEDRVWFPGPR